MEAFGYIRSALVISFFLENRELFYGSFMIKRLCIAVFLKKNYKIIILAEMAIFSINSI